MSDDGSNHGAGGVAPDIDPAGYSVWDEIQSYLIGLVLAAGLTVASFAMVHTDLIWGPGIAVALATLAVAQIGVHLVFFLHLTTAPDNTNNVLALAFGVLIVAMIIGGSLWIMDHLNHRMMPMDMIMQMQR
jgi:cytochrome o ubiquinol oxidase operon protein cyoD